MSIEFHRDGPWEIPEGWVWVALRNLVTLRGEKAPPDKNSPFAFIGMDDVPSNSLRIETKGTFKAMKSAGNKFYCGDVLYGRLRPYLNKVVVADFEGVASGEFIVMLPKAGIDACYLQLWMHARKFVNEATRDTNGDRPRIDFDKIANLDLALPPTGEQRRIVARIDELFTEIADGETALTRARNDLDTWRSALLKAAVTGELTREWREHNKSNVTGQDVVTEAALLKDKFGTRRRGAQMDNDIDMADLPELPERWVWAKLSDFSRASSYGTSVKCSQEARGVAVLRIPNVRAGRIDMNNLKWATVDLDLDEDELLGSGDLLIVRTNGSEDLIGRAAIVDTTLQDPTYFASYLIRFRIVDSSSVRRWIAMFFETPVARTWIRKNIASSAGQYNISQSALMRMPIPVPPEPEITAALTAFMGMESIRTDAAADTSVAEETAPALRQSILRAAFGGRLVEQDPCDEPADVLLARLHQSAPQPIPASSRRVRRARSHAAGAEP